MISNSEASHRQTTVGLYYKIQLENSNSNKKLVSMLRVNYVN